MINEHPDDPDPAAFEYDPEEEGPATHAETVRQKLEIDLSNVPGVTGTGIGRDSNGHDTVIVYVRDRTAAPGLPPSVEGIALVVEVTGEITPVDPLTG